MSCVSTCIVFFHYLYLCGSFKRHENSYILPLSVLRVFIYFTYYYYLCFYGSSKYNEKTYLFCIFSVPGFVYACPCFYRLFEYHWKTDFCTLQWLKALFYCFLLRFPLWILLIFIRKQGWSLLSVSERLISCSLTALKKQLRIWSSQPREPLPWPSSLGMELLLPVTLVQAWAVISVSHFLY